MSRKKKKNVSGVTGVRKPTFAPKKVQELFARRDKINTCYIVGDDPHNRAENLLEILFSEFPGAKNLLISLLIHFPVEEIPLHFHEIPDIFSRLLIMRLKGEPVIWPEE
jgi:hypothetical protein